MSDVVSEAFVRWLSDVSGCDVINTSMIQPLWSGYGACFRAQLAPNSAAKLKNVAGNHHNKVPGDNGIRHVVVKCATPPDTLAHPKGWNGQASDERKRHSFRVENSFYSALQTLTDDTCRTATCVADDQKGDSTLLVMEDLARGGYTHTTMSLPVESAKTVLKWLAHFHARFLNIKFEENKKRVLLWHEGSYWHLATREEEYQAMPDSRLKQSARAIAKRLANARYQTVIHGDAKVANFCFTPDYAACAAVDFQYVGHGIGVKDVAYFLGSALPTQAQITHRDALLGTYFGALESALNTRLSTGNPLCSFDRDDIKHVIEEWKTLYPFACADFYRFLSGWSPTHWKIDEELQYQTDIALSALANT